MSTTRPNAEPRARWLMIPLAMGACAVALGICVSLYWREAGQLERTIREREVTRVATFSELFRTDFQPMVHDILALASGDSLQAYLASGSASDLQHAVTRARFYTSGQSAYDKVRFLDDAGREVFGIGHDGQPVAEEKLQDDSGSPYFKKTSVLAPGEVFISAFDLNVEGGRVEEPYKPTIRFAVPVFDFSGHRRGVYVVNFLATRLISRLLGMDSPQVKRARLLNADGYWLKSDEADREWGFMIPSRSGMTMAKTDPGLWAAIAAAPEGQVIRPGGGLFTWRRVVPRDLAAGSGMAGAVAADPFLVVASDISAKNWATSFRALKTAYTVGAASLVVLVILGSWFIDARRQATVEQDRFFTLSLDLLCISSSDGYFKRVSNAVTDILGWSVKEFLSCPYIDFVHPDDREATVAEVRKQVVEGRRVLHFENRYKAKDGTWRVLSWRSIPYPGGLMYATARDVTDLKLREDQIRELNSDLRSRASQLESANQELEAFSYSVSHDLRAPIRHIGGFMGLLQKESGDSVSERGRSYMQKIAAAATQMGLLIDDLLLFSKMGRTEMHMARVDLNGLLREAIDTLRPEAEGHAIKWVIAALPTVTCDRSMIRQVFVNLLSNAIKYSGKRTKPEIEVGCRDGSPSEVVIFVRDNGVGFDMKYVHKLFGVFQRLHLTAEFEGTGIGLANVRRIIGRHGGRTWAEGQLDVGATLYFSLPRRDDRVV